ncbi:uncharacterized protein CIMG_10534 [Coccidioides immitis RS]|uniref:Uncharacterized protein n=1 Tax=Coccidioides immitis (strain RS) TaxID=246410 RepID=A0A0D8JVM8_COCIM|nr:uncharacterized protein CIMG_10534 [Coccidioides immitis RS]KJF60333.1 hypothetical protein CIMG_10534 [Coccidioides immitis RS]
MAWDETREVQLQQELTLSTSIHPGASGAARRLEEGCCWAIPFGEFGGPHQKTARSRPAHRMFAMVRRGGSPHAPRTNIDTSKSIMCGLLNHECKWSSSGPLNFNPSSSMAFSIGSVLNIGVFAATARRHEYGRAGEIPTGRIWLLSRLRVASTIPQENHMRINASTSHGKSFASFHCGEQLICA